MIKIVLNTERLIFVRVQAEPVYLQVPMPTSAHENKEVEINEQLNDIIEAEKGNDNLIIMGEWDSVKKRFNGSRTIRTWHQQ